jgi:toxin ParE1/3/4
MGSRMKFSLKITASAEEDLNEIYGYIANHLNAPGAAARMMDKIENGIMRLKTFPYSCSLVQDEPLKDRGYRKLVIDNYIVFHLINESDRQVVIMRVLYGASNYQNFL